MPFCLVIHSLSLSTASHFGDTLSLIALNDIQTITTSPEENAKLTDGRSGLCRLSNRRHQEMIWRSIEDINEIKLQIEGRSSVGLTNRAI